MATPEFIKSLREKVGTDLLQVPTATVMTYDDQGRLLLVKDIASGLWGLERHRRSQRVAVRMQRYEKPGRKREYLSNSRIFWASLQECILRCVPEW
ncbi:MAG: hypothetical protein IPK92_14770 [Nitrospira sp.]|nr:hypothetical protein [Nitrospira sp.]